MSNLAYGTFTITNLSVVTSVDVYYYNSTSSTSLSGGSWQTTTPTWTNGKYIWSKTVTTWEQGVTTQSKPVCITGQKGSTGSTGQSVTSIVEQYALSTSNTTAPTTGWSNTMPTFEANKYYWTRSKITWANPTNTTYTDAVLANGITSANTTANAANTTAAQANQTANTANQTANTASQTAAAAQSTANDAKNIANGKNTIYYSTNFPAGGTYKDGDTLFKQSADGYVVYEYKESDSQWVRKSMDGKAISAETITAGQIHSGAITTNKLASNAIQSLNYQAGTAPYSAFGTFLDLIQGNIYTPNFGVNNDSLDSIDDGAYIRGSIYAHKGTIGQSSTNYWYIGNYKDYNQVNSAMIKGYGTATIQLGESNTWRLNTNRIHTAWNDDSSTNEAYRLHYLTRDSKYWDMGLHVPTAGIDKFIYIRSSKNDTSTANILENLQNSLEDNSDGTNNYWTYKFFISADGGIYARNIYAIDENGNYTLISGANGAYLLKSGGTIQNNLVINGTLQVKGNYLNKNGSALTLQTNLGSTTAGTLTGNTTSAISIGVTGTLPSSNGGTGNTNWNQGGVVYIDGSSPKKLLSTAAGTSGYLLKANGTGAPTWINPATLTVAAATKATQDGDGNVIKTTYLKLSGGNVTGPVSFGDSVSVDDLNAGTLVVTGNASFTNNIQANTINGVVVGSSPKFTDTITTVTTTGSGNAITAITASNGVITATKGTTFLTSFTQSDPIFTASVAASIKQTDINNWNNKTSNTGTVTSVAASGSGGITISGSPITTSGTLAIGLNLSTAINGLGEGTSAANRNDYAVVQYAGGGTTTTSYHRRKLSNVFAALNSSDITTALGFTPYNATNPDGYTKNVGTVTSIATSSPITGGIITSSGTIGHATSGVGNTITTAGLYKFKYDTYGHVTGVTSVAKTDITGLGIPAQDTTYSNASTTAAGLMSAADKKKLDDIQVDSSGQAVAANVAGRWGIDVTFSSTNVAQVGHANSAITASNTQATKITSSVTSTQLAFGDVINFPYVTYDTYGHVTDKTNLYFKMPAAPSSTGSATNDSDGNPINTTYIKKSIGTAAGDIIYWSASGTPVRLAKGSNGQVLKLINGVPAWGTDNNDNTTYSLSGSLSSHKFTTTLTPSSGNATTSAFTLAAGSNISLTDSGTTITIAATDVKVTQTNTTDNADYRLLFSENANDTDSTETAKKNTNLKFNPSSGLLKTYGISSAAGSTPVIYSDVSAAEIKAVDSSLTTNSSDSDWLKALLAALCTKYPGKTGYIFKGTMTPNSVGWYEVHIYSTSAKDSTTGLPQYSFGRFLKYINNYELFGTSSYSYSYRTVDTNTWNALSTSQAGYVSTAPNDTTKFLCGDATWAQVSSANLSGIRLTWQGSVSTTDWILAHDTAATGTPLFRAMSPANLKTTMSLNNVENKSSATIRGELTLSNVTTALGYTPVNKAGDTMTGVLNMLANQYTDSYSGALNMNNSNIYGVNSIYTADLSDNSQEGIHFYRTTTTVDTVYAKNGNLYFVPNRTLGANGTSYNILHEGNYASILNNTYVTLTTAQDNITGRKTFSNLAAATFKPSSGDGLCNINYNSSLNALVFSFV